MSTPLKSVNVDWKKWEKMHRKPSLLTRIKLFFTRATVTTDYGFGGDYSVKQYWKNVDGKNHLVGEEIIK